MCLILFAFQTHPRYALIVIANRDEYYARPTEPAHWWQDSDILAGRDLEAGGTWLGVSRAGRFAAVTNVREPGSMQGGKKSRGALTTGFLSASLTPEEYLARLASRDRDYAGFNLLVGGPGGLWFYSNRDHGIRRIEPGVHGVSNGAFDEPWPKLSSGKAELEALLTTDFGTRDLLEILTDHRVAPDHELPDTGVAPDIERMLSSRFIRSPDYGTRACTVLTIDHQGEVEFCEQNYLDSATIGPEVRQSFGIDPA